MADTPARAKASKKRLGGQASAVPPASRLQCDEPTDTGPCRVSILVPGPEPRRCYRHSTAIPETMKHAGRSLGGRTSTRRLDPDAVKPVRLRTEGEVAALSEWLFAATKTQAIPRTIADTLRAILADVAAQLYRAKRLRMDRRLLGRPTRLELGLSKDFAALIAAGRNGRRELPAAPVLEMPR